MLQPLADLLILKAVRPVCLGDAFADCGAEECCVVDELKGRVSHQLLRICSDVGGDLC